MQNLYKFSLFHPNSEEKRRNYVAITRNIQNRPSKYAFDSADYFIAQQEQQKKINEDLQEEQKKEQIILDVEQQQVEQAEMKFSKFKTKKRSCNQIKKKFDSADYFIKQEQQKKQEEIQRRRSDESVGNDMDKVVEQQSEKCEVQHICNKMSVEQQQFRKKSLIKCKKYVFDSADYFIEQQQQKQQQQTQKNSNNNESELNLDNNNSMSLSDQSNNVEKIVEEQSNKCELQYIVKKKKKTLVEFSKRKQKQQFDSADYWLSVYENKKSSQEEKENDQSDSNDQKIENQEVEENEIDIKKQEIDVKNYQKGNQIAQQRIRKSIISDNKNRRDRFDSAEYFMNLDQKSE